MLKMQLAARFCSRHLTLALVTKRHMPRHVTISWSISRISKHTDYDWTNPTPSELWLHRLNLVFWRDELLFFWSRVAPTLYQVPLRYRLHVWRTLWTHSGCPISQTQNDTDWYARFLMTQSIFYCCWFCQFLSVCIMGGAADQGIGGLPPSTT